MEILEKGFYYNFKHDPEKDLVNYAYFILPYPAGYSEDNKVPMCAYVRVYKTPYIWVRPIQMFFDNVSDRVDNPTKQKMRFAKIQDQKTLDILLQTFIEMYPDIDPLYKK